MDWTLLLLKILLTGILFIILAVVCALLVTRIQRTLTVQNKREHIVRLSNQGNFMSIFNLSVVSIEQMFSFQFLLNNIPLMALSQVETQVETFEAPSTDTRTPPSAPSVQNKTKIAGIKPGPNVDRVVKGGRVVAAKAGQAASILSTLASLLPGSLGDGLRAQSEQLRQAQVKTQMAAEAPESVQRRVDSLRQQTSRFGAPTTSAGGSSTGNSPAAQPVHTPIHSQAVHPELIAAKKIVPNVYTVQTQPVEPGGSLSLTLRVEALKRSRPAGTYAYTLSSQQLPVNALDETEPPVTTQGILHFPPVDGWRYWQAPTASSFVIAILMLTLIFGLRFIWSS